MNSQNQPALYEEEAILRRAAAGDLESFNQVVLRYQDMAYHHAYSLVGEPDLAEDAVQEGLIKAFQRLDSFRGGSFRGWLLKIVTNSAYDLLRQRRRYPTQALFPDDRDGEEIESPAWLADHAASVQATVEQRELSLDLSRLLEELPAVYRAVLTLVDVHELDYGEAAQALHVPIGTVKSRLARGRLQMRKKLNERSRYNDPVAGAQPCLAA
jgi:RNA polymerase sigma-70 factor (ECF subfamily)